MGENKWRVWNGGTKHTRWPFGIAKMRGAIYVWVPSRKMSTVACCNAKVRCKRWRRTLGLAWPL